MNSYKIAVIPGDGSVDLLAVPEAEDQWGPGLPLLQVVEALRVGGLPGLRPSGGASPIART